MQFPTQRTALLGFLALFIGLMPAANGLADNLLPPQQIIQSISEQLQKKLQDKSFAKDFAKVTAYVDQVIDPYTNFDKIAPLVLGKHWKTAPAQEQERFKQEFRKLLVRTYSRAFVEYNDWTLRFVPLDLPKDAAKIIVKTEVLQPGRNPVEISYRMFLNQGHWQVYDIIIEGVSLVTNYRSSISEDILHKGSLGAVIDSIAQRNVDALKPK